MTYLVTPGMAPRCASRTNEYKHYGGRGVTVCDRWRQSFENFYEDVGPKPKPYFFLDRINNDGNYEPDNCRWTTPIASANNRHQRQSAIRVSEGGTKPTLSASEAS